MLRIKPISFLLVMIAIGSGVAAQKTTVWKKQVERTLYLPAESDSNNIHKVNDAHWVNFNKGMVQAAMKGTIEVYEDAHYKEHKKSEDLIASTTTWYDTEYVQQPPSTHDEPRITKRVFDYSLMTDYRILEEWTYDLATTLTTIKILGVGFSRDFNIDGVFRGSQPMFWIKWNNLLKATKDTLICAKIGNLVWQDYFKDSGIVKSLLSIENNNGQSREWHGTAIRSIKIASGEYADTTTPNLKPVYDSCIAKILYESCLSGSATAYSNFNLQLASRLSPDSLKSLLKPVAQDMCDFMLTDPVIGKDVSKYVDSNFDFDPIDHYYFLEDWNFDFATGQIQIKVVSIAPVANQINSETRELKGRPYFWLSFTDTRKALITYNMANPGNNIELKLWQDRFNETKHPRHGSK